MIDLDDLEFRESLMTALKEKTEDLEQHPIHREQWIKVWVALGHLQKLDFDDVLKESDLNI